MYNLCLAWRITSSGGGVSDGLECEQSSLEPANRCCGGGSVGREFATVYCRQDAAQQVRSVVPLNPIERHRPIVPPMAVPAELNSPRRPPVLVSRSAGYAPSERARARRQ